MAERFGIIHPPAKKTDGRQRIWLHAVSVGELNAIRPLLTILKDNPALDIVLSVTTTTARRLAEEKFQGLYSYLFTFPIDCFSGCVVKSLAPDKIILTDSELWPELLYQAQKRKIFVGLVNARMSDRSFRRLRNFSAAARWMVKKLSLVLTATHQDTERYLELGANPELVYETGSLKFDTTQVRPLDNVARTSLLASLGYSAADTIIIGSSTWPGEEAALISAYVELKASYKDLRLLLVPRHAERGGDLEAMLKASHLNCHRRSTGPIVSGTHPDIVLADTTGELSALVQLASIVFVGKSLKPHTEGQSPIEPAAAGKPVIMGYGMSNFRQISQGLVEAQGGVFVGGPSELKEVLQKLLSNEVERNAMGDRAFAWFDKNRGATQRTLEYLELVPEAVSK